MKAFKISTTLQLIHCLFYIFALISFTVHFSSGEGFPGLFRAGFILYLFSLLNPFTWIGVILNFFRLRRNAELKDSKRARILVIAVPIFIVLSFIVASLPLMFNTSV